jgi:hypothetical protein
VSFFVLPSFIITVAYFCALYTFYTQITPWIEFLFYSMENCKFHYFDYLLIYCSKTKKNFIHDASAYDLPIIKIIILPFFMRIDIIPKNLFVYLLVCCLSRANIYNLNVSQYSPNNLGQQYLL